MDYKYVILAEEREKLFNECVSEAPFELRLKLKRLQNIDSELIGVIREEWRKNNEGGLFGGGGLLGLGL